jgi:RimJ/RimL family protein N-acetyltransferase
MIRLEQFGKKDYDKLISWIDSEEMLMQFGGPIFTFPLTAEQLDNSLSDANRISFSVVSTDTNLSIGHCEIYQSPDSVKIGRIIIGDKEQRGKGYGQQITRLLLDYIFSTLPQTKVELNVFDWNINAIKCYEKAGFTINPDKRLVRKIKTETWTALNMVIDRQQWNRTPK